jgi:hypothetical protein
MASNKERAPFHLTPILSERFQASGPWAKSVATPSHQATIDPAGISSVLVGKSGPLVGICTSLNVEHLLKTRE